MPSHINPCVSYMILFSSVLSPSLNHKALDFCLQLTYTRRVSEILPQIYYSGAAGEGFSPVSPLLAVGSVNASFPVIESCVGATEAGLPANEGISSGAEPIPPLAMIPACSLSSVSDIVSGTLVEVPVGDLGEYLEQEGSFRRISQDITKDGKDENVKDCVSFFFFG
jgi:hypothetical protein